jgi:hypothetical protein
VSEIFNSLFNSILLSPLIFQLNLLERKKFTHDPPMKGALNKGNFMDELIKVLALIVVMIELYIALYELI